jgi:hypothetical protein
MRACVPGRKRAWRFQQGGTSMASDPSARRTGNPVLFFGSIIFVAICAAGGLFYLLPQFVHPFTADTVAVHTPHVTIAAAFFVVAVLGLIVVRANRPPPNDGTIIQ